MTDDVAAAAASKPSSLDSESGSNSVPDKGSADKGSADKGSASATKQTQRRARRFQKPGYKRNENVTQFFVKPKHHSAAAKKSTDTRKAAAAATSSSKSASTKKIPDSDSSISLSSSDDEFLEEEYEDEDGEEDLEDVVDVVGDDESEEDDEEDPIDQPLPQKKPHLSSTSKKPKAKATKPPTRKKTSPKNGSTKSRKATDKSNSKAHKAKTNKVTASIFTSLSTKKSSVSVKKVQMKGVIESMLSKSTEDTEVEYVDPKENSSKKYTLMDPIGKTSQWWNFYLCFHPLQHPELAGFAYCNLPNCGKHISTKHGTGGLQYHLRHKHREVYNEALGLNLDIDEVSALLFVLLLCNYKILSYTFCLCQLTIFPGRRRNRRNRG